MERALVLVVGLGLGACEATDLGDVAAEQQHLVPDADLRGDAGPPGLEPDAGPLALEPDAGPPGLEPDAGGDLSETLTVTPGAPAVVFVLDLSGSMGTRDLGDPELRRSEVVEAALLDWLVAPPCAVGLVLFDSVLRAAVPPTAPLDDVRHELDQQYGTNTDWALGLQNAHRLLDAWPDPAREVLFITDGYPNEPGGGRAAEEAAVAAGDALRDDGIYVRALTIGASPEVAPVVGAITTDRSPAPVADDIAAVQAFFATFTPHAACHTTLPPGCAVPPRLVEADGHATELEPVPHATSTPDRLAWSVAQDEAVLQLTAAVCAAVDAGAELKIHCEATPASP